MGTQVPNAVVSFHTRWLPTMRSFIHFHVVQGDARLFNHVDNLIGTLRGSRVSEELAPALRQEFGPRTDHGAAVQ